MEHLGPETLHEQSSRERKLAVCTGAAALGPADRAEILVVLSTDPDEDIAHTSQRSVAVSTSRSFCGGLETQRSYPRSF